MIEGNAPAQLVKAIDKVEDYATTAADKVRDVSDRAGEVASNLKGAVDQSVKDQPMATLAVAAVLGFVLGALWKS